MDFDLRDLMPVAIDFDMNDFDLDGDYCDHFIDPKRCVMCGPLEGKVFDARCNICNANTWHTDDEERRCLKCGTPGGDPSTSMLRRR